MKVGKEYGEVCGTTLMSCRLLPENAANLHRARSSLQGRVIYVVGVVELRYTVEAPSGRIKREECWYVVRPSYL